MMFFEGHFEERPGFIGEFILFWNQGNPDGRSKIMTKSSPRNQRTQGVRDSSLTLFCFHLTTRFTKTQNTDNSPSWGLALSCIGIIQEGAFPLFADFCKLGLFSWLVRNIEPGFGSWKNRCKQFYGVVNLAFFA